MSHQDQLNQSSQQFMSYGGTREQGFQGEQMQRSENILQLPQEGKWKAKYDEFIQKVPCTITMKLAWGL